MAGWLWLASGPICACSQPEAVIPATATPSGEVDFYVEACRTNPSFHGDTPDGPIFYCNPDGTVKSPFPEPPTRVVPTDTPIPSLSPARTLTPTATAQVGTAPPAPPTSTPTVTNTAPAAAPPTIATIDFTVTVLTVSGDQGGGTAHYTYRILNTGATPINLLDLVQQSWFSADSVFQGPPTDCGASGSVLGVTQILLPGQSYNGQFFASYAPEPQFWPQCVPLSSGWVIVEIHTREELTHLKHTRAEMTRSRSLANSFVEICHQGGVHFRAKAR